MDATLIHGESGTAAAPKPRAILVEADGTVHATITGGLDDLALENGGNLGTVADGVTALVTANHADLAAVLAAVAMPRKGVAVTKSDSTDLSATATKGIWVGGAGDVAVMFIDDTVAVSILAVSAGTFLPGSYKHVMATGTTATSIIAFS